MLKLRSAAIVATFSCVLVPTARAQQGDVAFPPFECGIRSPAEWMADVLEAVKKGQIPDPRTRVLPRIPPGNPGTLTGRGSGGCLSHAHVFSYEDSNRLLVSTYSNGQLINLMVQAANALIAQHGDNFDFIGFWTNFDPSRRIGTAFYKYIENDVQGIGDPSTQGTPIFNLRPQLGLAGDNIEGFIMMWNINSSHWAVGANPSARFTRLALGQEYEHRWAMYLPPLPDGRRTQGTAGCGRIFHWNWRVDGQGSCMELSEWVGRNPARLAANFVSFNTDTGGLFGYTDLYLMGYVSPSEMDAGNSELRYMEFANCSANHFGTISSFSSADIVASAGPRVPDWTQSQKDFRSAWIMLHQPGSPPTSPELDKTIGILEQHMLDWSASTLGRGTMNNALFGDCSSIRIYGCGINPTGSIHIESGLPSIGSTVVVTLDNPVGTQVAGASSFLFFATRPDPMAPCGTRFPGFGMSAPGADGELLISITGPNPIGTLAGPTWQGPGSPAPIRLDFPANPALIGADLYAQGLLFDPSGRSAVTAGLTDAIAMRIGR